MNKALAALEAALTNAIQTKLGAPMKLQRYSQDGAIGGVCLGMSEYFGVDLAIMRIMWLLFLLFGPGFWVYLVCWICMPDALRRN